MPCETLAWQKKYPPPLLPGIAWNHGARGTPSLTKVVYIKTKPVSSEAQESFRGDLFLYWQGDQGVFLIGGHWYTFEHASHVFVLKARR